MTPTTLSAPVPVIDWTATVSARRILSKLRPADLYVRLDKPLIGPDRLIITGQVVETLGEIREQHAEDLNGRPFREALDDGKDAAGEWLDVLESQPTVQAVLTGMFGDPNLLRGHGVEKAGQIWRLAAEQGLSDRLGWVGVREAGPREQQEAA